MSNHMGIFSYHQKHYKNHMYVVEKRLKCKEPQKWKTPHLFSFCLIVDIAVNALQHHFDRNGHHLTADIRPLLSRQVHWERL